MTGLLLFRVQDTGQAGEEGAVPQEGEGVEGSCCPGHRGQTSEDCVWKTILLPHFKLHRDLCVHRLPRIPETEDTFILKPYLNILQLEYTLYKDSHLKF